VIAGMKTGAVLFCVLPVCGLAAASSLDLRKAVVVVRPGEVPLPERTAATVLIEELEKRSGIRLSKSTSWPEGQTVIAITSQRNVPGWKHRVPLRYGSDLPETRPDGYRLYIEQRSSAAPILWIMGADPRGTLYGVGELLRKLDWGQGELAIETPLSIASAPAYAIRGHQLGYRAQANSYDAWTVAQFEQYIRELAFFGVNSIEGIPFQDDRNTPVMKFPRREMNRAIGEICKRYGLDYWVWVPADFDLRDETRRRQMLQRCDEFFRDTPGLTGFFFPGGDPGSNAPQLVFPFLEDIANLLRRTHPEAKIWLSVQQFNAAEVNYVYDYIDRKLPPWLGGLVAGPSSPPLGEMRSALPKRYMLRDYPDLTHNKLCQYPVPEWDQAFALTEGREACNPRPVEYAAIFHRFSPYTNGFISYSDGIHDDVNKIIWSALSWNPNQSVRDILVDYARVYFKPRVAEHAADGILALENNWHGPLNDHGSVEGTLLKWRQLEKEAPQLESNWRWQLCLLRANYDAYIRSRLIYETKLESDANAILADSPRLSAENAMAAASQILNRAVDHTVRPELRKRIFELCDELFHSIGLQTSVPKYYAIAEERGAVLDFVDYPLNNRWWLEDQFKAVHKLGSEEQKDRRLQEIATWEHPGPGSFYDDVGNIEKSPHVVHCDPENGPQLTRNPEPTFWWWDEGKSRARLSWQVTMWPIAVVYEALDPNASYIVRSTGAGQALLRINGDSVQPIVDGTEMGEFKEFPVAAKYVKTGRVVLTWDRPQNEEGLNWRKKSRLAEVWLIKLSPSQNERVKLLEQGSEVNRSRSSK
jgi:hypothetical protein